MNLQASKLGCKLEKDTSANTHFEKAVYTEKVMTGLAFIYIYIYIFSVSLVALSFIVASRR